MKVVIEDLTKEFQQPRSRTVMTAVSHFSFEFPDGRLICLLGPSGCGKSTLLNMICGLESPTHGSICFGDTDVTDIPAEHRGVGMVFQNYALYPHMTVKQNIRFPLENLKGDKKLSPEEMDRRVEEAAKLVQIEKQLDKKPSEMSGGQQQRVAIARALVKQPQVLLLDEPLSNLDARLRLQTREEIRRIQKETGITAIFVTHDQEEAMSISDMIVVMKEGVYQQSGHPQKVYDDPANLFVAKFLGTPQINTFEGSVRDGKLYIADDLLGEAALFGISDRKDRPVYVCIRPEGFIPEKDGPLHCTLNRIEVMGRDTTVLSSHPGCEAAVIRSIIGSGSEPDAGEAYVNFSVKPNKLYLFDRETEERIR